MTNFKTIDRLVGWTTFVVATLSYLLTIEPTASYWDCGEFICTAFRQEVGHPPGAPLFMIIGRVFSLLAFGNVEHVASMINSMSAVCSGLTVLFLYWSISHIATRIVCDDSTPETFTQKLSIIGSALVGALAYAYTDTFWFSAVEGEVYAMSSLFTAVVFWCILKWEQESDQPYANRWLVLICYLMGLSIGVHLLNLLVIPAIVFVYYFRKFDVSSKGIVYATAISIIILGGILYGIIPGVVWIASRFELMFTNFMGLPYNTGTIIYAILGIGALCFGLWYTFKNNKVILNTIFLCVSVIIIGYSSFAMIVIRSAANPPMDENNPNNVFALQSYLNREQYGDRPLITGEYFNSELLRYDNSSPTYIQRNNRYEIVSYKPTRVFADGSTTFFPRMYSQEESHINGYMKWADIQDRNAKPSMGENLTFFVRYQLGYMYWRYFLWNFAGRQNDIQGHDGNLMNGNWISGISWFDNSRLGDLSQLPQHIQNNRANNQYYFLPLILGLLGMWFMYKSNIVGKHYFWIVMMFFVLTGVAIVVYLNQTPYQPRERDYAYAGSFYAFAFYIGFGVAWLCNMSQRFLKGNKYAICAAVIVGILAGPVILAVENWDDHDRSERYTARDFAKNYLESCAPNAILFTNGDNDTFPLWYAQEVEGIRTDVRVVNLAYINTDWYINQMRKKAYLSSPLPISIEKEKLVEGSRDIVYYNEVPTMFFAEKLQANFDKYSARQQSIHDDMIAVLRNSNLAQLSPKDYEAIVNQQQLSQQPLQIAKIVNTISQNPDKYGVDVARLSQVKTNIDALVNDISKEPVPIKQLIDFVGSDSKNTRAVMQNGEMVDYVPTLNFMLEVDKQKVLANGTVPLEDSAKIVDRLEWRHSHEYIRKGELMVLDILANNNWERPVYFAITVGREAYQNLDAYFRLEGLAYRVVPIRTESSSTNLGYVNTDIMYDLCMNKFVWGGINNPKVYLDENNLRMLMNVKSCFYRLAQALINEGKKDKAIEVLDKAYEIMPMELIAPGYYDAFLSELYYKCDCKDKARKIIDRFGGDTESTLKYLVSLMPNQVLTMEDDYAQTLAICHEIVRILRSVGDLEYSHKFSEKFTSVLKETEALINVSISDIDSEEFFKRFQQMRIIDQQLIRVFFFLMEEGM